MSLERRSVLVITSQVVRGRVGARASVFALERLGYPAWFVPTVTLPWHPGHGKASRIVAESGDFVALLRDLENAPWLGEIAAVLTGYLGAADQAAPIAALIAAIRGKNPDLVYCCDPVIGDNGGLYVPEAVALAIRDELVPLADAIVPNRFEFDWLIGKRHDLNEEIVETAQTLPHRQVIVTSAHAMMKHARATLLCERAGASAWLAEHRAFDRGPNGTGDLFAGLMTARLLRGGTPEKARQGAVAGVFEILAQTAKAGADELLLVEEQDRLERPMAVVSLRRIGASAAGRGMVAKPVPLA